MITGSFIEYFNTHRGTRVNKRILFLMTIVFIVINGVDASANSAPSYWRGKDSSEILAIDKSTPIEVVGENLIFDFNEGIGSFSEAFGKVTASYKMVNTSEDEAIVQMAFPFISSFKSLNSEKIQILADGQEVEKEIYPSGINLKNNSLSEDKAESLLSLENIFLSLNNSYEGKILKEDTKRRLIKILITPENVSEINIALNLNYNEEKSKIIAFGINGFHTEEGKVELTSWCNGEEYIELLILGEDIDYDINGYTDGEKTKETAEFSREINVQEVSVADYLIDKTKEYYQGDSSIISEDILYKSMVKRLEESFENSFAFGIDLQNMAHSEEIFIILYTVNFKGGEEKEIEVSYNALGSADRRETENPVYTYNYLLNPAENWKSFKDLKIEIIPPKEAPYIINSTLELNRTEEGHYVGNYQELPKEDLSFSLYENDKITLANKISKKFSGLLYGAYFLMPIIVILALVIIGALWIVRRENKKL